MNSLKMWSEKHLTTLEQILKTDIRYLLKGGVWLGGGQILTSLATFILSLIFANLVSPDVYGTYKYLLSIAGIFGIFTLTGMDAALTRSIAQGLEGDFMHSLFAKLRWGLLAVITGVIFGSYYFIRGNYIFGISMIVIGIGVPLMEGFDLYNSILNGKKLYKTFTYYNVFTQVLLTLLLGVTLLITKSIAFIIIAYFVINISLNLLFLILSLKKIHLNTTSDPVVEKYAKHLSAIDIINVILNQLDDILVFHYLGAQNLAIYILAIAPTDQIKGLFKNLNFLALPKFAARSAQEIKAGLNKKIFALSLAAIAIMLFYIIFSPFAFAIFFPKYLAAIKYSQILAISLIGAIGSTFLYIILQSKRATNALYHYNLWNNIVNLILIFPLIIYFGLWGAVAARLITRFFTFALGYILVMKMPEE